MNRLFAGLSAFLLGSLTAPVAFAEPPPERLIIATWNLEWFYDDHTGDNFQDLPRQQAAPTAADWEWKLDGVAKVIAEIKPTILALQEIENRRVLFYLTRKLKNDYGLDYSVAFVEGDDYFTEQDVAVLAQSGLVGFGFKRQTKEMFASNNFYNLSKHVFCQFEWSQGDQKTELLLINVHLRAGPESAPLRARQARLVRHWIGDTLKAGRNVIVLGDVNTDETYETTTPVGDLGTLRGLTTTDTSDDLIDVFAKYQGPVKETHLIHKQFDHILASPSLYQSSTPKSGYRLQNVAIRRDLVLRGTGQDENHQDKYWQIPAAERDVSDHYPVVAEFALEK